MTPTKFDRSPAAVERRRRVMKRLENQLLTGFKTVKDETSGNIGTAPLTEEDRKRIIKELETLKTRL